MSDDSKPEPMPNDDRHTNPSGLPDEGLVLEHEGKTVHLEKTPQPVPAEHHEEGHEEPT